MQQAKTHKQGLTVYIIAGEASGDALGARVMASLQKMSPIPVTFHGIGGEKMHTQGLESLFPLSELSIMGVVEVLPGLPRLLRRIHQTVGDVKAKNLDMILTIDAPDFSKRVVKALKEEDILKVHYVAPSVWAWRAGRAQKFADIFDYLLALLPFEPPYFEAVGLECDFVGHSVLESGADKGDGLRFCNTYGLKANDGLRLCLLPGSRKGEVMRHLPTFIETYKRIRKEHPQVQAILPTLPHLKPLILDILQQEKETIIVTDKIDEKYDAMDCCHVALAASGTVCLELSMARLPMTIGYKINGLTHLLVSRLIKTPYASLVNILLGKRVIPERIQKNFTVELLTKDVLSLLGSKGQEQIEACQKALEMLAPPVKGLTSADYISHRLLEKLLD